MEGIAVSLIYVSILASMVGFSQGEDVKICEHTKQHLTCKEGEEIHVLKANWGGHKNKAICKAHSNCKKIVDKLWAVKKLCQRRQVCELKPHHRQLGDNCPGIVKYLAVSYICKKIGCNADQMQCDTNRCISLTWKCDGARDCADGKDEQHCQNVKPTKKSCLKGQFQCTSSEKCITIGWRCDGNSDCDDNSDELNCGKVATTTHKITTRQRTLNPTDTTTAPTVSPKKLTTKTKTQQPSTSGTPAKFVATKTTEHTMSTPIVATKTLTSAPCPPLTIACRNGACVYPHWMCDGINDCGDNSDEDNCITDKTKLSTPTTLPPRTTTTTITMTAAKTTVLSTKTTPLRTKIKTKPSLPTTKMATPTRQAVTSVPSSPASTNITFSTTSSCKSYEYRCGNGRCIFTTWRCDGFNDCGDFSDESGCSNPVTTRLSQVSTKSSPTMTKTTTSSLTQTVPPRCPGGRFACKILGHVACIPRDWTCDNEYDCDDGVDETSCGETTTTAATTRFIVSCKEGQFKCKIRREWRCISGSLVCNGFIDCHDGTDELFCGTRASSSTISSFPGLSTFTAAKMTTPGTLSTKPISSLKSTFTTVKLHTSQTTQLLSKSASSPATTKIAATVQATPKKPTLKIPTPTKTTTTKKVRNTTLTSVKQISTTTKRGCFPNDFICESRKDCIPMFLICDGRNDCPDGSDEKEENCKAPETCGTPVIPPTSGRKRIVGGRVAIPGSWPWMATLRLKIPQRGHMCGATLISPRWLLTATHCFAGKYVHPWRWTVHLSKITRDGISSTEQVFEPKVIVTHDDYDPLTSVNDIALVKLQKPVRMNARVSPVCLPGEVSQPVTAGQHCFVAGFGETRGTGGEGLLKQTTLRIMGVHQCNNTRRYNGRILGKMFCAEDRVGKSDACQGDSGGGFFCKDQNHQFVLRGVTSWGEGCASPDKPGVYTDVHKYMDWITATIRAN